MKNRTIHLFTLLCLLLVINPGISIAASGSSLAIGGADASLEAVGNQAPKIQGALTPGPVPDDHVVSHEGLDWVWASACNGGCGQPDPANVEGWRFATDEELQLFPGCDAFGTSQQDMLCASEYFDDGTYTGHCDWSDCTAGYVASSPYQVALNGQSHGSSDSFFVRGELASAGPVPTLSQWALIILSILLGAIVLANRKRLFQ